MPALAAERRNVYRYVTEKDCLAPEERNAAFRLSNVSLLRSLEVGLVVVVYKHLVPLGPKTTVTKNDIEQDLTSAKRALAG